MNRKQFQEWLNQFPADTEISVIVAYNREFAKMKSYDVFEVPADPEKVNICPHSDGRYHTYEQTPKKKVLLLGRIKQHA